MEGRAEKNIFEKQRMANFRVLFLKQNKIYMENAGIVIQQELSPTAVGDITIFWLFPDDNKAFWKKTNLTPKLEMNLLQ